MSRASNTWPEASWETPVGWEWGRGNWELNCSSFLRGERFLLSYGRKIFCLYLVLVFGDAMI